MSRLNQNLKTAVFCGFLKDVLTQGQYDMVSISSDVLCQKKITLSVQTQLKYERLGIFGRFF